MSCKKCGHNRPIKNKFHGLCLECNNLRLYGNKFGKQYSYDQKPKSLNKTSKKPGRKSLFVKTKCEGIKLSHCRENNQDRGLSVLDRDELFYKQCFDLSPHRCEECGESLPCDFRDSEGKIIARWRYSHIVAKSIAPDLRHDINNINHLCVKHHAQWDFGDKKSMKIYNKNQKRFPRYLEEL